MSDSCVPKNKQTQGMACRESSKNVLKREIARAETRVAGLKAFFNAMDWDSLTPQQDDNLWSWLVDRRN